MWMKIAVPVLLAIVLTPVCQRLMAWCLEHNRDSLAEYSLEPGPVCSPIGLGLGLAVALFLGMAVPASVIGKAAFCYAGCGYCGLLIIVFNLFLMIHSYLYSLWDL